MLTQLAVLAAASIVCAGKTLLLVMFDLEINAKPHAGDCLLPCRGNRCAALLAMVQTLAFWQAAARMFYRIFNARIDLFLHRPVAGPSTGHRFQ